MVFLTAVRMRTFRKAYCSPPLVGEDNSMVFTSHSVPFPATHDLRSLLAGNDTLWETKTFNFLHTSDGEQILIPCEQKQDLDFPLFVYLKKEVPTSGNEYLFTVTGVKKMKWICLSRSAISSHKWPKVTTSCKWLWVRSKNHWIIFVNQWRWTMSIS